MKQDTREINIAEIMRNVDSMDDAGISYVVGFTRGILNGGRGYCKKPTLKVCTPEQNGRGRA